MNTKVLDMSNIIIDLNLTPMKELARKHGSDSNARYALKQLEQRGLATIVPMVKGLNKITFNMVLQGETGFASIDSAAREIQFLENNAVSEILKPLSADTFGSLIHLVNRYSSLSDEENYSKPFSNGIYFQFRSLYFLLYFKETLKLLTEPAQEWDSNLIEVLALEFYRRERQISDYHFEISNPHIKAVTHWPIKAGIVKSIDPHRKFGFISTNAEGDIYFKLDSVEFQISVGDLVKFSLKPATDGDKGPEAVFITKV